MTPLRSNIIKSDSINAGIKVMIATGKRLAEIGCRTVHLVSMDKKLLYIIDVLHILGLDRHLLLVKY